MLLRADGWLLAGLKHFLASSSKVKYFLGGLPEDDTGLALELARGLERPRVVSVPEPTL